MYTLLLVLSNVLTYFGFCCYYYIQDVHLGVTYNTNKVQKYTHHIWYIWKRGLYRSIQNTTIDTYYCTYTSTPSIYLIDNSVRSNPMTNL